MKTLTTSFALLTALSVYLFSNASIAQQSASTPAVGASAGKGMYKLTVVLSGVNKRTGKFYVGLADSEESFDKKSLKERVIDVPATGEVSMVFDSLVAGKYAVRLYQDLNDNKKIDFAGQMPTEPFGFSNVSMVMGPPTFGQCAFDLAENKTIEVNMIEM